MKNEHYKHNVKTIASVFIAVVAICALAIVLSGNQYKKYLGLTEYPNCMKVDEYGDAGNDEGCIRHTRTLTPDYQDVYSLSFETFYMNNEDNASQKYVDLLDSMKVEKIVKKKETHISDVSRVTCFKTDKDQVWYIVKEGTTLYKAYGINCEMDKKQRWFDVLKINYKVPDMI
ncbi:hypothetical protein [Longibaculum muris]|uniref:hypothetical protein n=1 Tax=Longibaculum muris TaxID=1796628 RepID=UPI0012B9E465|nr:hypothetical protein [Longibaculum muris]